MSRFFRLKLNNGSVYEVEVEEMTAEDVKSSSKQQPKPEVKKQETAPASPAPTGGEKVTAPMPGTIKKVAVTVGAQVKKNDVLFILEAMKLENEIYAPCDGKITHIGAQEGQSVNPGDALCTIG